MAVTLTDWLRNLRGQLHDPDTVADAELLTRFALNRDEGAFAALVARHGPMVFGVCRRVCGPTPDAEDAFQAAFVILAVKAHAVARSSKVGAWLHGVAFHTARKARDRSRRSGAGSPHLVDALPAPEPRHDPDAAVIREKLDEVLAGLPERYRSAVVLCDLEGLSRKEAAARLGWSEGTLSGRLARARDLLADRLSRRGVTVGSAGLAAVLSAQAAPAAVAGELAASALTAAALVAGGLSALPPGLAALTHGVTRAMFPNRLHLTAVVLGLGLAAGLGSLFAAGPAGPAPGDSRPPTRLRLAITTDDAKPGAGWVQKAEFKHDTAVTAVAFGPDLVASGDADGNVILWDLKTGKEREKLIDVVKFSIPTKAPIDWLAFNTDGTWLYVINMERSAIHACRLDPNNRLFPGFGGNGLVRMLGFSPGGEYYFYVPPNDNKTVAFFNNEFPENRISGMVVSHMRHDEPVVLAAMSADTKAVVTVTEKGTIFGWAFEVGDVKQRWAVASGKTEDVTALVISPDGKHVAVAGKDGTVRVLNVKTGKGPMQTRRHDGAVHAVVFSPDGKWLATAGEDKLVRVWDAETGKGLATLKGHTGAVTGVAFSPDGAMITSASEDKTVRVWEYQK